MNYGHQDVDVIEGVRPAVAQVTTPRGGQVAPKRHLPLALELSGGHQDEDFDALPEPVTASTTPQRPFACHAFSASCCQLYRKA